MFLDVTARRNPKLIETAFQLHQKGLIEPDTYILDVDTLLFNATNMKKEADKYGIKLYFMTKQLGRNPYISKELMRLGFEGTVAVDYREADILYENGIKLGNVGHLVQIPSSKVYDMVKREPEVITVYSIEKAEEISRAAVKLGIVQNIMLRVIDKGDILYPAQYGGFYLQELTEKAEKIQKLPNVNIYGITSFPCFLYNEESKNIEKTKNVSTLMKAKSMLEEALNIKLQEINTPSATCTSSIKLISECGGTHGEPGHGLLGTTPLHAVKDEPEIPAIVYVSEISHNLGARSYCYGGGYYRRSHMKNALTGKDMRHAKKYAVQAPSLESIDYYFELEGNADIGDTVIMAYRTQIFVTRSRVAVVKGIQEGNPKIAGLYDSLGKPIRR